MRSRDELVRSARERYESGDYQGACRICSDLLAADPCCSGAVHPQGWAPGGDGSRDEARMRPEAAVAVDPGCPDTLRELGRLLRDLARWDEAAGCFRRVAALRGDSPSICTNLSYVLRRAGDLEGSAAAAGRAVELAPEDTYYHLSHAVALHRAGQFRRGWEEYEWRLHGSNKAPAFGSPRWDGSPLEGRTILIHAEQGLGDQIQFIRYAPMVAGRGGRVLVHCSASLARLVRSCPGVEDAVAYGTEPLPEHDVHVWSGSLPHIFATEEESIPAEVPYLFADGEQVERWRKMLSHFGGVRVGINWEGSRTNVNGRNRAIPLAAFHPLGRVEGVHLFSLQQGEPADQLQDVPGDLRIVNVGQFFKSLWATAAFMEQLNLVVTNDTSLAHLAGALGRPVWVILPEDACWRWRDSGEGSRWYPTMRLFRQGQGEDWCDVLARVRDQLEAFCAETGQGGRTLLRSA